MSDKKKTDGIMIAAICLGVVMVICVIATVGLTLFTRPAKLSQSRMQENMAAAEEAKKAGTEQETYDEYETENYSRELSSFEVSASGSDKEADAEDTKDTKETKKDTKKKTSKKNKDKDDTEDASDESEYLCSYSSERLVTEEDVAALNAAVPSDLPAGKGMIQMVINEIYARHGYKFETPEIQAYFDQRPWYQDITVRNADMNAVFQGMSDIEKKNVEFLNAHNEEVG